MKPQEFEKRLAIKLQKEPSLKQLMKSDSKNSYTLDENGDVIGLNVCGNKLADEKIAFLWRLPELKALNLSENRLTTITIPKGMNALSYLKVSENRALNALIFESELSALDTLDVSECGLVERSIPPGFNSLQTIYAQQNKLRRFKIERNCPNLKYLDLAGNQLQEFSLPESMPFGKLNGLPQKGRPVSSYPDRDQAWLDAMERIEKLLE